VPGFPEIEQDNFYGMTFCGKRGGSTFTSAIRPDYSTGVCPTGTLPCSLATSLENTICTLPTKTQNQTDFSESEDCPITEILILSLDDERLAYYN
jgi:hypothetical protein